MSRTAEIANHPDRAQIEIGLANNIAMRTLAKRYGLTQTQLSRWRNDHMPEDLIHRLRVRGNRSDEELAQIREIESKSLLDHFSVQRARLYVVADRAGKIGDDAGEIRALAEAGKVSERIGKLLGDMGAHTTINNTQINFTADPRWHAIRTELVRALKPHREAWPDAVAAIERAEAAMLGLSVADLAASRVLEHQATT
jgi:transcriptional regulator with XRE-family HTH domain